MLRTLLLAVLALAMSPGVLELLDDGVHLLTEGRTDHGDEAEACPEHGCTATAHYCACCTSLAFANTPGALRVPTDALVLLPRGLDHRARGPRGVAQRHQRPPIA